MYVVICVCVYQIPMYDNVNIPLMPPDIRFEKIIKLWFSYFNFYSSKNQLENHTSQPSVYLLANISHFFQSRV